MRTSGSISIPRPPILDGRFLHGGIARFSLILGARNCFLLVFARICWRRCRLR